MSDLALQTNLLAQSYSAPTYSAQTNSAGGAGAPASQAKIKEVADKFEQSFIAAMLQPMFDSLSTAPPFGGGEGEAAFKSFMVQAIAKETAKNGGLHLSQAIQREMLKMQGAH